MGERLKEEVRFGKYSLLERIAVGGMAEIFLARQAGVEGFEKLICIKKIRGHLSSQKSFVNMFLNEAKLAAQLNHPNIVQIYDLGRIGESYFIAMEYVHGRDMRAVLPRAEHLKITPFPLEYALKICSAVCEGLFYAHGKTDSYGASLGIVHRDISPENILVSYDGGVKITDYGIAKATTQLEHTRAGEIKGKLSYMSPEQCRGEKVDHRSDLFSLGVVLYEWLTGVKMFTGDSELEILQSIINGKIYPARYFRDDIPEKVEGILNKALAIDRDDRYQSAWDMQYDIDSFLAEHEFTPSNVHLANFMRQLFARELEQERTRDKALGEAAREPSIRSLAASGSGSVEAERDEAKVLTPEDIGAELVDEAPDYDEGVVALSGAESNVFIEDEPVVKSQTPARARGGTPPGYARQLSGPRAAPGVGGDGRHSTGNGDLGGSGPRVLRTPSGVRQAAGRGDLASPQVAVDLSPEVYARLVRTARRRGESAEAVVREMVEAFLRYSE